MGQKLRIGALISGGGSNLQAIINACEAGTIDGEVVFVGSDNPDAKGLQRALKHNIPIFTVNYSHILKQYDKAADSTTGPDDFNLPDMRLKQSFFPDTGERKKVDRFLITRAIAEAELLAVMKPYEFDLLVLAGFMRNLTPYFIDRVNTHPEMPRIMNIHPALLPAFPGVDGYGDTFRYGCKIGGCTVHFIDYGEDSGPIIGQRAFDISSDETLDDVKKRGSNWNGTFSPPVSTSLPKTI